MSGFAIRSVIVAVHSISYKISYKNSQAKSADTRIFDRKKNKETKRIGSGSLK